MVFIKTQLQKADIIFLDRKSIKLHRSGMLDKNLSEKLFSHGTNRPGDLMISVSGIRGTIPGGLDPLNIVLFTMAFARITGKKIILANDARATGPFMKQLISGTLMAAGKEVIDIGLAPTPTAKAAVKSWKADAGIMISASHNPPEWNAFKFIDRGGFFFDKNRIEEIKAVLKSGEAYNTTVNYKKTGSIKTGHGIQSHIMSIMDSIPNVKAIKKMRYRVVVDAVGGAGREGLPELLRALGCEVTGLFCDPHPGGTFPRPPEPTPASLKKFDSLLRSSGYAAGFALDPDADRLVIGSKERGCINEEYTVPLAMLGLLGADSLHQISGNKIKNSNHKTPQKGTVVVNLSTANLVDDLASRVGWKVVRSAVGEANVVEKMKKVKAIYGGEGNGGVIHPRIPSYGRDSLVGAALILSAMTTLGCKSVDELMELLPPLFMQKTKFPTGGKQLSALLNQLKKSFPDAVVNEEDGLYLSFPDGSWVHTRASNTEPIIRVIAQAPNKKELKSLIQKIQNILHT